MELVFENGQIFAKGQRSNVSLQNQRRNSIMDLYEAEYNDDFKKSSIHGSGGGSVEFTPPDEHSVVAERSVDSGFDSSSTDFTEDSEGSMYLSSSRDDEYSDDAARPHVPARTRKALVKRKRRADQVYTSPERKQRNDINKKMRTLQDLLPNSHEDDKESLLDEAINYTTNLQLQLQMMKIMGNRFVTPSMMLPPAGLLYSQMDLAIMCMGMQMGAPQFLLAPVLGAGLPAGINNSANMLRFLNNPGIMPMQNSPLFTPMAQSVPVPPSSAALPNQMPNPISLSYLDEFTRNQGPLAYGGILFGKTSGRP